MKSTKPRSSKRSTGSAPLWVIIGCGSLAMAACAGKTVPAAPGADVSGRGGDASVSSANTNALAGADSTSTDAKSSGRTATRSTGRPTSSALRGNGDPIVERGGVLYTKYCALCHGDDGDGTGKFAYLMNPRPRNFKQGDFKLSTTTNQIPTDDDLVRTISRGMPGSAMPPWGHLPLSDLQALAKYVRIFHLEGAGETVQQLVDSGSIVDDERWDALVKRTAPGPPLVIPPEPPFDELRWFSGRRLYLESCASCHGADGNPVPEEVKFDAEGYPVPPRSFVNGIFKGGSDGHQLYVRILKGMKGTPMPASEGVYGNDEMWDIIHYVQSLARAGAQERAQLRQGTFVAPNVRGPLPTGPTDSAWEHARPVYVALTPLWWTEERIEGLVVQALHNDEDLAIRLSWIDPTQDDRAVRQTEFRDGVAIQFSLSSDPPFYMGDTSEHGGVNIWYWKADRQKDIDDGYQDVDQAFPDRAIDMYPEQDFSVQSSLATEWPRASIHEYNRQFLTAWGAGNLVANPDLGTPVECLVARGPGTLAGKPADAQLVQGSAVYERGVWRVQLQRRMELPHEHDGHDERLFRPGDYLPVSFAIWNGSAGDRDGKKNISIWQKLVIE
ncbi:MAG: c-type cytochrome [Planctomycetes bacterium]|nr:c-type cytochrome [Planctomycetota bacterium]